MKYVTDSYYDYKYSTNFKLDTWQKTSISAFEEFETKYKTGNNNSGINTYKISNSIQNRGKQVFKYGYDRLSIIVQVLGKISIVLEQQRDKAFICAKIIYEDIYSLQVNFGALTNSNMTKNLFLNLESRADKEYVRAVMENNLIHRITVAEKFTNFLQILEFQTNITGESEIFLYHLFSQYNLYLDTNCLIPSMCYIKNKKFEVFLAFNMFNRIIKIQANKIGENILLNIKDDIFILSELPDKLLEISSL